MAISLMSKHYKKGEFQMDNTSNLISKLSLLMQQFIISELEKQGIKGIVPSHGSIIVFLLSGGNPTMNELAKAINKDPSTVTTLVKKLTNLGYTEISKDENDKRASRVSLTSKGKEFERIIMNVSNDMFEKQYQNISENERYIFRLVLEKMITNFN